jgi:hypothetical protein
LKFWFASVTIYLQYVNQQSIIFNSTETSQDQAVIKRNDTIYLTTLFKIYAVFRYEILLDGNTITATSRNATSRNLSEIEQTFSTVTMDRIVLDDEASNASTVHCGYEEDPYACIPERLPVPDRTCFSNHLTARDMLEMSDKDKKALHSSSRRLQYIASTEPAGALLKPVHLLSMDNRMLQHLFLEWTDLQLHKNLQEADEIREGEELEYHQRVADEMEYIDHDDYNTPSSSSDSVDY